MTIPCGFCKQVFTSHTSHSSRCGCLLLLCCSDSVVMRTNLEKMKNIFGPFCCFIFSHSGHRDRHGWTRATKFASIALGYVESSYFWTQNVTFFHVFSPRGDFSTDSSKRFLVTKRPGNKQPQMKISANDSESTGATFSKNRVRV